MQNENFLMSEASHTFLFVIKTIIIINLNVVKVRCISSLSFRG